MNRAYSFLRLKSLDDDARVFSGVATTPTMDRVGDIIEPLGIQFKNPMALLRAHDAEQPIGNVTFETPTAKGIAFTAQLPIVEEPGLFKDRVDMAWSEIKYGVVKAVSIGFRPIEYSYIDNGGIRFTECEVLELSTVAVPANADAVINIVKSIDHAMMRAAGLPEPDLLPARDPATLGKSVRIVRLAEPARDRAPHVIQSIKRIAR